jgi:hypothetical protein
MRSRLVSGALCALLLAGCGSSLSTAPPSEEETTRGALVGLGTLLRASAEEKKRPPANLNELEPYSGGFVFATSAIQQKKIVYVWGAGMGGGTAIVGYDANAPTAGGLVLLQDGTVKRMSASEFASAPKAK